MKVLVGVDVGTTRLKAVVTDFELNLLHQVSVPTPWVHRNNLSEIDMNILASTAITLIHKAVKDCDAEAAAIAFTGFSETGALTNEKFELIAPGFAWHDPRGDLERVEKEFGSEQFERTVGASITSVVTISKIMWQQKHLGGVDNPGHFFGAPEWIAHALGAEFVNELSLVSRSGFLDIAEKSPWLPALDAIRAGENFLGRLVGAGEVIGKVSDSAPENLRGAVLTIAGHDHQTAAYHLDAVKNGALFDSMGTAEAIVRTREGVLSRESMSIFAKEGINVGWTVIPHHQTILAGTPTGISLERVSSMLDAQDQEARAKLGTAALLAVRDDLDLRIEGSYRQLDILGITDGVTPAHIWRAAVEDLTENFKNKLDFISAELGDFTEVTIGGGWIHNPMVKASKDLQYGKYKVATEAEPGAMGAAEFAGVALGVIAARWEAWK